MARQGTQSGGTRRGYKQTEIGEIPVEWNLDTLDNTADVKTGGTPSRSIAEFWNGNIPWMSSGEVNKRFIYETEEFITDLGLRNSNAQYLPVDTVMIALNGQGKTRGSVALIKTPLTCNQSLAGIVFDQHKVCPIFGFFFLENNYLNLRHLTGDDARNGLNLGILRNLYLPLPPLPEQKKIAAILSSVDDAIRSTQAVIDQARTLKKGLLGQLLTRGIGHKKFKQTEIGEIPVEWEVKTLIEVCSKEKYAIVDGPFGSNLKTEHYRDEGVPVVQSGFVTTGKYYADKYLYVDQSLFNEQKRSRVVPGDIVMAKIGANAGSSAIVTEDFEYGILAGNCLKVSIDKEIVNNQFILYWFHYRFMKDGFIDIVTVTAQPAISLASLRKVLLPLPPLAEQKQIAEILSGVDAVIRQNSDQVEQLKRTKAGLMQDLLTGRKRVAV